MLTQEQMTAFHSDGYVIVDFLNLERLKQFRSGLYNMALIELKKRPELWAQVSSKSHDEDFILNDAMIALERKDHSAISHIYDTLTSTSTLLNVVLQDDILDAVNQLLDRPTKSPLFLNSIGCRMDTPGESPFLYGWHYDKLTNTPGSRWVQLWLPAIGPLTKLEGGLDICPGSHKKDFTAQFDKIRAEVEAKNPGAIFRIPYHTPIDFQGLTPIHAELQWGQGILFKENFLHRSGFNQSVNRMRYCMTSFYHDVYNPEFFYRSPRFQFLNKN